MLDDLIDVIELVFDGIFGVHKLRRELDNDLIALLQQAHEGKTLSASLIATDNLTAAALCCPLTPVQLRSMRSCTEVKQQRYLLDVAKSHGWRNPHIVVLVTVDLRVSAAPALRSASISIMHPCISHCTRANGIPSMILPLRQ